MGCSPAKRSATEPLLPLLLPDTSIICFHISRARVLQKSSSSCTDDSRVCTYVKISGKVMRQPVMATVLNTIAQNADCFIDLRLGFSSILMLGSG